MFRYTVHARMGFARVRLLPPTRRGASDRPNPAEPTVGVCQGVKTSVGRPQRGEAGKPTLSLAVRLTGSSREKRSWVSFADGGPDRIGSDRRGGGIKGDGVHGDPRGSIDRWAKGPSRKKASAGNRCEDHHHRHRCTPMAHHASRRCVFAQLSQLALSVFPFPHPLARGLIPVLFPCSTRAQC